jgi:pimeloyl-ACP methyl ester carboxylesterase
VALKLVRRILIVVLALLLLLAGAGAIYQVTSVRREAQKYRPAGQLIDVGGRRLHLLCIGTGDPTVVFEPSGLGGAGSSGAARDELAKTMRVCSYDRMGMGFSDPGPASIPVGVLADDLEHLLDRAGIRPPYVLVASSMGGLTAELFARRHPDRVAGMVFLDAAYSGALDRYITEWSPMRTWEACATTIAARLGVLRMVDPLKLRWQLPPEDSAANIAAIYRPAPMSTFCGMMRGIPETERQMRTAPPFPSNMPLVVLTAEEADERLPFGFRAREESIRREWAPLQLALAQRSRRGTWRVVPGSTHLIGNSQPHAVASAVFEVLAQAGR